MNWRAKKPTMTVGMPARISSVGLSTPGPGAGVLGQVDRGQHAEGRPTAIDPKPIIRVPFSSGSMP